MKLVDLEGNLRDVSDKDVAAAKAAGYTELTPEEAKRVAVREQPIQAAVEGAGRAATFGFTDAIARKLGADMEAVALRKEENPVAEVIGQTAGVLGGLAVGGPAALVAKGGAAVAKGAAAAVGRGALGKLTGAGAGAAVEGGLYGLGQVYSEQQITGKPADAQKVASTILQSALAAGGLGIAFKGVGLGVNRAANALDVGRQALAKRFSAQAIREYADEAANELNVKQFALKSDFKKNNLLNRAQDVGKLIDEEGIGAVNIKNGPEAAFTRAEEVASRLAAEKDAVLQKLDDASYAPKVDPSAPVGNGQPFDGGGVASRIQKELVETMDAGMVAAGMRDKVMSQVVEPIAEMRTFREADSMLTTLRKMVTEQTEGKSLGSETTFRARGILKDALVKQIEELSPGYAKTWKRYADALEAETLTRGAYQRSVGNLSYGPMEVGAALAAGGGLKGLALGVAARYAKQRGSSAAAVAFRQLSKSKVPEALEKALQSRILEKLGAGAFAPELATQLSRAATIGGRELLGAHTLLAQTDPTYLETMGLRQEDGPATRAYSEALGARGLVGELSAEQDKRLRDSLPRVQNGDTSRQVDALTPESYKNVLQYLDTFDPQTAVPGVFADALPGDAVEMMGTLNRAIEFLRERAPRSPDEGQIPAMRRPWRPSTQALRRFQRLAEAVSDPVMAMGQLHNEEIRAAMERVYPEILEEFQAQAADSLAELKNPLMYDARERMRVLLGAAAPGYAKKRKSRLQANFKSEEGKQSGGGGDGRQVVNAAKNLQTQAQRIEFKG